MSTNLFSKTLSQFALINPMPKTFDEWNEIKKKIDDKKRVRVKLGEVFWCYLGLNIGVEQDGNATDFIRPVLIIKKFSTKIVLIAPLTTQIHQGDWYFDIFFKGIKQQIIINQIRPVDTKRLIKSIGHITQNDVKKILNNFIELLKK